MANKYKIKEINSFKPENSQYKLAVFRDENTNNYGYIDENGHVVIPPIYYYASDFEKIDGELRAVVAKGTLLTGRHMLINENGKRVSTFFDDIRFDKNRIKVLKGRKYGLIDVNGKIIVSPIYDEIRNGICTLTSERGRYKNREAYDIIYNRSIKNAKYGKPISIAGCMTTQVRQGKNNFPPAIYDPHFPTTIYDLQGHAFLNKMLPYNREVYVNIDEDVILNNYKVVTNFKEMETSKIFSELRAIAIDKATNEICLIDQDGYKLLKENSDEYTIEDAFFENMYFLINKKTGVRFLYDMDGQLVIDGSYDITITNSGLILVKNLNGINSIYDKNGVLLRSYVDYVYIFGTEEDKYLVADYYSDNKRKREVITNTGNRVNFGFDYDYASEYNNGYFVLSREETDYQMNDPLKYTRHFIVKEDKSVVCSFPKNDILESFSDIHNYADYGFFICMYENYEKCSVIDLNGNEIFSVDAEHLEYKNGVFIAESSDENETSYRFYDMNGKNLFDLEYFDNVFHSYKFTSDNTLVVFGDNETTFVNLIDNHKQISVEDFPQIISNGPYNPEYFTLKRLGEYINGRDKILVKLSDEVESFRLVKNDLYRIEEPNREKSICNMVTNRAVMGLDCCYEIIISLKPCLKYFDLANFNFSDVMVSGIDFSETNALIDPQTIYNKNLDGCILRSDNLVQNYYLEGVSCKGTIIDGRPVEKEHEKILILH